MRVTVSWGFVSALVALVALATFFLAVQLFGGQFVKSTVLLLSTYIFGWLLLIVTALIGAFLAGAVSASRIMAKTDFTPFEEEMLKMRKEVREIKRHLGRQSRPDPGEDGQSDPVAAPVTTAGKARKEK